MRDSMPLVSIIVPVYNTEKYLRKCLTSLVNQSLEDIEIIVIDDGSKDNSCEIIQEFTDEYPSKLRFVHRENGGISDARNMGMEMAKAETIAFVDSDDSVHEHFCKDLYEKLIKDNLDVVVCDFEEVYESGKPSKRVNVGGFEEGTIFEFPHLVFHINTSPWNKLYRKDFLEKHQIRFPLDVKYEDAPFLHQVLSAGARIGKLDEALVYYLIRKGSETTRVNRNVFDIFKVLDLIRESYQQVKDLEIQKYVEFFCINRITVYNLQQTHQTDADAKYTFIRQGFEYLDSHYKNWRSNPYFIQENGCLKRLIKKHEWFTKAYVFIMGIIHK